MKIIEQGNIILGSQQESQDVLLVIESEQQFWEHVGLFCADTLIEDEPAARALFNFIFSKEYEWSQIHDKLYALLPIREKIKTIITLMGSVRWVYERVEMEEGIRQWYPSRYTLFQGWVMFHVRKELEKQLESASKQQTCLPLFKSENDVLPCIDILKKVKPPVLDKDGSFIKGVKSKSKGSIVAWIQILEESGKLNHQKDSDRAEAINLLIPNLKIDGRSLSNKFGKAYCSYMPDLKVLFNKM